MKVVLRYVAGGREAYADDACRVLSAKISAFVPFSIEEIKASRAAREQSELKKKSESIALLKGVEGNDFVLLFDEKAPLPKDSVHFSEMWVRAMESGRRRVIMMIGGPFGFSEEIRTRADLRVSFSPLTFNHHVAKIIALEQVYRAFTIWRGLPYHNV